jgi:DNA-binding transcriptional regulator YhcF (GntR family)
MPDNIDLNRIREVYANMQDEELLHFARKEGMRITADAFLLLRAEMHKRNIGHEILFALEHEFILQDSLKRKKLTEDLNIKTLVDATEKVLVIMIYTRGLLNRDSTKDMPITW